MLRPATRATRHFSRALRSPTSHPGYLLFDTLDDIRLPAPAGPPPPAVAALLGADTRIPQAILPAIASLRTEPELRSPPAPGCV